MRKNNFAKVSYKTALFSLLLSFFSLLTVAYADTRPEAILENATQTMLSSLKSNHADLKQNPNKLYDIVDNILVPHVDTEYMAKWVVGRQYWSAASEDQRKRFVTEFKRMVVRSYASSLLAYSNQEVTYYPIKGEVEGKSKVQVSSVIKQPNGETIKVAYRLLRAGSTWKVYDIIIEGVSLMQGFQSQFADDLRQMGLERLIEKLHAHNAKPLTA